VLKFDHHCPVSVKMNSCFFFSFQNLIVIAHKFSVSHLVSPTYSWTFLKIGLGINQCVGLHNERHFVLFLYVACFLLSLLLKIIIYFIRAYLVFATSTLSILGYQHLIDCLGISYQVCNIHYQYIFPFVTFFLFFCLIN
jgi:hypothetical protein